MDAGASVTLSGLGITDGYSLGHGAGIYNKGDLTLEHVAVVDSNAQSHGGGIYNYSGSTLTLSFTTIDNNTATYGGGISGFYGVGPALTIDRSTISNNTGSGHSGGMSIVGTAGSTPTEVLITSSTFSGNDSGSVGGAIRSQTNTELTIVNTTITDNTASSSAGGVWTAAGLVNIVQNSIIAGNRISGTSVWATDASGNYGGTIAEPSTGNLVGIAHSGLYFDTNLNLVGSSSEEIDPGLAPLAGIGGPTWTHAPLSTSAAIGIADSSLAPSTTKQDSHLNQWAIQRRDQ